jgi:hypothetical protein
MATQVTPTVEHEPPLTPAQLATARVCQYFLYLLCASAIALFPAALVYRVMVHLLR